MDLVVRHPGNPILSPNEVASSTPGMTVECLLNPGVFKYDGLVWILVRVAERPVQEPGKVSVPILVDGNLAVRNFDSGDPLLDLSDPREVRYAGQNYLSTLSHLRLFRSSDGIHFEDAEMPLQIGLGGYESFGVEDCRVSSMPDGEYLLTYTAASSAGYGVGLRRTHDWKSFVHEGMIFLPPNKDCAIFEEKIGGRYACLSRPSGVIIGGHYIWLSFSKDLRHWGDHTCIIRTRRGQWDSSRVGAGAAPIRTDEGWLVIYHGADDANRYCLGATLLDIENPSIVLARSKEPIFEPETDYEKTGFFGEVVFTNGHTLDGDLVHLYYGAADTYICKATLSLRAIIDSMQAPA